MFGKKSWEHEVLLTAMFGSPAEFAYDEETETNMLVRVDVRELDRIVGVGFEDPRLVAN